MLSLNSHRLISLGLSALLAAIAVSLWVTSAGEEATGRFLLLVLSLIVFWLVTQNSMISVTIGVRILQALSGLVTLSVLLSVVPIENFGPSEIFQSPIRFLQYLTDETKLPAGLILIGLPYVVMEAFSQSNNYAIEQKAVWSSFAGLLILAILASRSTATIITLGLVTFTVCFILIWHGSGKKSKGSRRLILLGSLVAVISIVIGYSQFVGVPFISNRFLDQTANRIDIYRQSARLVQDFIFTGSGLGSIPGVYAYYSLGLPVKYLPHTNNLYLNVALELGMLGLLGLVAIFFGSVLGLYRSIRSVKMEARSKSIALATCVSIIALFVLGLIDDPIYMSWGLPALFLLPGLAINLSSSSVNLRETNSVQLKFKPRYVLLLVVVLVVVIFANYGWISGAFLANLGTIEMAKVQLSNWPSGEWSYGENASYLHHEETLFQQSLEFNSKNRTALHRLGLIAMESRNFDVAVKYLQEAHQLDPTHRGIKKALGFSLIWSGNISRSEALLSDIPEAIAELHAYEYVWNRQDRPDLAGAAADASQMLAGLDN